MAKNNRNKLVVGAMSAALVASALTPAVTADAAAKTNTKQIKKVSQEHSDLMLYGSNTASKATYDLRKDQAVKKDILSTWKASADYKNFHKEWKKLSAADKKTTEAKKVYKEYQTAKAYLETTNAVFAHYKKATSLSADIAKDPAKKAELVTLAEASAKSITGVTGKLGATSKRVAYLTKKDASVASFVKGAEEIAAAKTKVDAEKALTDAKTAIGGYSATFIAALTKAVADKYPVVTDVKVETVTATNLKEVVVAFTGAVDKTTAENEENYTLDSGTVDYAVLSEDGKTVTLTLVGTLGQQQANKLSVKGVKAGDKTIEVKDFGFTPLDNTLPTVVKVEALGNKAIKVTYSEPIKTSTSLNYKLDGKSFYGNSNQGSSVVILTPYDSTALTVGEHTLESQNVVDYNNLKSLISETKFSVVEDKVAPTMTNVDATLEKVTVTFSEEIDPSTIDNSKVYWMNGTTKYKAASNKNLGGGKFSFDFSANPLPGYETTLYVEGVKDYSGNAMTATTIAVKATVDQTRPEVVQVKAATDRQSFTVKFNKKVQGVEAKHFTVTDKDGKVRSINTVALDAAGTTATVTLYSPLPEGTNTVKVAGIQDATTLKNTMLDYTTTFVVGDLTKPSIATSSSNGATRQVIVSFSEKMDVSTIGNASNYLVTYAGSVRTLPAGTEIAVIQDQKAVMFTFPAKIDGTDVTFGTGGLTNIKVLGVKDVAGNLLSNFTNNTNDVAVTATDTVTAIDYSVSGYGEGIKAVVTDKNTIKFKLNKGIASSSNKTGVTIGGYTVDKIVADGSNVVTIKTVEDMNTDATPAISIAATNGLTTVTGSPVNVINIATGSVYDEVAPKVVFAPNEINYKVDGPTITVNFSEVLDGTVATGGVDDFYANDLVITRSSDNAVLKANVDYTTTLTGTKNGIEITLKGAATGSQSKYTVEVKDDAKYITDLTGNYAEAKAAVSTNANVDLVAASVVTKLPAAGTFSANATHTLAFSEELNAASLTSVKAAVEAAYTKTGTATVTSVWNSDKKTLTVTIVADATNSVTLAAIAAQVVTDISGNTSAALAVQN